MKSFLGVLVVVAACGKVEDPHHLADAPPAPKDGEIDAPADAMVDAPPPRCDPSKPFGTPVSMGVLDTGADEFGITLTADELTAVFSSTRSGGSGLSDLYVATRASKTAAFGAPALLANINTTGSEQRPTLTGDGLVIYYEFRANPNAGLDIMRATRANATAAFGTPALVTVVNSTSDDTQPFITPDNSTLLFTSTRGVNGDEDIYIAAGNAGSFAAPTLLAGSGLQTTNNEGYPVITPDGLTLYFRSDRGGMGFDIWTATRANLSTGFSAPLNVSALNTNLPEFPAWVSADNCVIYFSRNIGTVASNNDLFFATKPL